MHVIGHNDPRQKPVALTVKMQQRIPDHLRDAVVFQPAGAMSLIGVTLDSAAKPRTAGVVGSFATTELQLGFPGGDDFGGNRVNQAESEKLHRSRFIEVWEVATIVPGLVRARRPRSRGGPFDRLHCLHRLIREGCQRNERCEKSLQRTSSAMEADGLFVHQQRSDASLIPGIHTNGKLCFWNESPTLTAYLGWSSPGSAGVSPASLFLQTASRPPPLPRKVHQTRLYGVRFPRARLCAGETPAFPGGFLRARVWEEAPTLR